MSQNNKPVHSIRVGMIKASIWKNEADGKAFYNVTFSRSFKDAREQWQETGSYGHDDLLVLEKLTAESWRWICGQRDADRAAAAAKGGQR